jgi:hypothetical protein
MGLRPASTRTVTFGNLPRRPHGRVFAFMRQPRYAIPGKHNRLRIRPEHWRDTLQFCLNYRRFQLIALVIVRQDKKTMMSPADAVLVLGSGPINRIPKGWEI